MSWFQSAKAVIPLQWKLRFHEHKSFPGDLAGRVMNRLKRQPAIPNGKLIYLIGAHQNAKLFLEGGRSATEAIRSILNKNSLDIEKFEKVLDFGCGVGRLIRHWSKTRGPAWHGTDYNAELIEWCKSHLKFAEFRVNSLSGELPYESAGFDFIYAFSVFTHLDETLQDNWLNELSRVLKPGGHLYLTTHGEYYLSFLTPEERAQFQSGRLVVRDRQQSGSNVCAVFHPASYAREKFAANFIVTDFIPCGADGNSMQDVHLLKKPL